jgi:hypothetical protein
MGAAEARLLVKRHRLREAAHGFEDLPEMLDDMRAERAVARSGGGSFVDFLRESGDIYDDGEAA